MTTTEAGRGEPEILILPDARAASAEAARRIAQALEEAVAERGVAHFVTTGGSTPGPIYRELARQPLREAVPWEHVHLWWTDDRWAPPDDPLSNTLAAFELLLGKVSIPPEHVHPMRIGVALAGGFGPEWAAARYAEEIRAANPPVDSAGFPILDVVLLGMGPDGHLLSVFPGSATWDDPAWVQAVPAPTHVEPHVDRVTLHPLILDAARLPIMVVHGAAKAAMVGRIFGSRGDVRDLPARLVRRPGAVWILDEAAAEEIPPGLHDAGAG